MECHGSIEHKPRNEEKTWTTVPSIMSGVFNGGSSHRLQARPSRECMMNDSSRDGRLYWVVQRSPEEKPEVYRYKCCEGDSQQLYTNSLLHVS